MKTTYFCHLGTSAISELDDKMQFLFQTSQVSLASLKMGSVEDNEEETEDRSTWKLRIIDPEKDSVSTCKLCHRGAQKEDSGLRLGPLYSYGFCLVHHYCLMFRCEICLEFFPES